MELNEAELSWLGDRGIVDCPAEPQMVFSMSLSNSVIP